LTLNLCVNYGGKDEIVNAVNKIIKCGVKSVDETAFVDYLYNPEIPDVDLMVRTSGELRISNFMLYRAAYAELFFTDVLWPDFSEEQFNLMLNSFGQRTRKFGDIQKSN
jgi:undecaprenyl diphosphate synthase